MPFVVLFVPFFAFVAALVLIGLSQTHTAQHGSSGIRGYWDFLIHDNPISQAAGLSVKAARALVSRYAASHLKMLTAYLNGMAHLWKQEFAAMRAEAKATADVAHALERAIPREAHKAAVPALARAKVADRHATRALGASHANARELHRFRTQTRARLKVDAHAIDVTIPHDLAGLRERNKALERKQTKDASAIKELENGAVKTFDWIRSHPLSAVTGVFAGAVVVALSRLGYGFLRCRSWQRLGRSLTCNDANILADLLAAATLIVGVMSLEELAREEQKVVGEAAKIVRGFWGA